MPSTDLTPTAMGMSDFDARAWSGVNVFDRAATNVSLATFADGQGVFDDPIDFLSGRCSLPVRDLNQDGQAAWTASSGAGTFEVSLNASDKFVVRASNDGFTITDGADYGFRSGQSSTAGGGWNTITAENDWVRGVTSGFITVEPDLSASFQLPTKGIIIQNPIVALRAYGDADVDDVAGSLSLEFVDNTVSEGSLDIRWGINASGHVFCVRPTATSDALAWVSTSFRDRLGFSGNEAEVTASGYATLTADYPLPGVIPPSRETDRHEFAPKIEGGGVALLSGDMTGYTIASFVDHEIKWWLDGPGDATSLHQHFMRRVVPYLGEGSRFTWYQDGIGDTRRAMPAHNVTASQDAYDVIYTSQDDGYRGRIRGHLHSGDYPVRWPSRLMRRVPVTLILRERAG